MCNPPPPDSNASICDVTPLPRPPPKKNRKLFQNLKMGEWEVSKNFGTICTPVIVYKQSCLSFSMLMLFRVDIKFTNCK